MTDTSPRVTDPAREISARALSASARRQSLLIGAAIAGGIAVGAAGLALGGFTLGQGWSLGAWNFIARGAGILVVSSLVLAGVRAMLPVRSVGDARSVPELVDLGLDRAIRAITVVRLGLAACVVAGVFGLAGAAIRYAAGNPPALSPVVDLALLFGSAVCLLLVGIGVHARLLRFARLRSILGKG